MTCLKKPQVETKLTKETKQKEKKSTSSSWKSSFTNSSSFRYDERENFKGAIVIPGHGWTEQSNRPWCSRWWGSGEDRRPVTSKQRCYPKYCILRGCTWWRQLPRPTSVGWRQRSATRNEAGGLVYSNRTLTWENKSRLGITDNRKHVSFSRIYQMFVTMWFLRVIYQEPPQTTLYNYTSSNSWSNFRSMSLMMIYITIRFVMKKSSPLS